MVDAGIISEIANHLSSDICCECCPVGEQCEDGSTRDFDCRDWTEWVSYLYSRPEEEILGLYKDIKDILEDEDMTKDMVNHPQHYISKNGVETIDVIEAWTEDLTGPEAVLTGNVIKYISRWKKKTGWRI